MSFIISSTLPIDAVNGERSKSEMAAPIRDLKKDVLEQSVPISVLLRRAILIARARSDKESEEWMTAELNGYEERPDDVPKYRILYGQPMIHNSYVGWEVLHYQIADEDIVEYLTSMPIMAPIAQVETYATSSETTMLQYAERFEQYIRAHLNKIGKPAISLTRTQFQKILEVVRNRLFDWVAGLPDENESVSSETRNVLIMPEKITLKWLWHSVPIGFWLWFLSLIVAAFVAGVFVGQISVVQEFIGKKPNPIAQPSPTATQSK
jgi:hypothetical protein